MERENAMKMQNADIENVRKENKYLAPKIGSSFTYVNKSQSTVLL